MKEMNLRTELAHIATIDAAYWMLSVELEKFNKIENLGQIEKMIDKASGFNPYKDIYKNIKIILTDMISSKKALGYDVSQDLEMMKTIKEGIKRHSIGG